MGTFDIALRGVPESRTPLVLGAAATGKKVVVTGADFGAGAKLLVDGVRYKQARNDASNPTTVIIAPKLATKLAAGQSVVLKVRNPDGQLSNEYTFTA